jgi:ribosomal protein L11 methyltransferase
VVECVAKRNSHRSVDWGAQWALFAEGFKEGKAHIDLSPFGGTGILRLYPGPGFGDLSHPTTRLMLQLMRGKVSKESIVDIGSGSGILTLAALLMGSGPSLGIDIDPDAIIHANENAKLNGLKARFSLQLPTLTHTSIFLMNMIFPEQRGVSPFRFNAHVKKWITSGVLEEQKAAYLAQAAQWGWRLEEEQSLEGWCGFVFSVADFSLS